jgi:hypothetical protein
MTEELVIDRRAGELGIQLDDAELEAAIQEIKKDYPEDEFEQMLLESAIPFSLWKDRLRVRLLMEKVVDRELVQPVEITTQDIEDYYSAHEADLATNDKKPPDMDLNRSHRGTNPARKGGSGLSAMDGRAAKAVCGRDQLGTVGTAPSPLFRFLQPGKGIVALETKLSLGFLIPIDAVFYGQCHGVSGVRIAGPDRCGGQ